MNDILTEAELYEMTKYRQPSRQAKVLRAMGIKFNHLKHCNTIVVRRAWADFVDAAKVEPERPKLRAIK